MNPDPALRERLIQQARMVAEERGWTWREPVEVTSESDNGEAVWVIRTNVLMRSPSVKIAMRRSDLALVRAGYLPR